MTTDIPPTLSLPLQGGGLGRGRALGFLVSIDKSEFHGNFSLTP